MVGEYTYRWEDDNGDYQEVEVHFEFTPGSKGEYNKLPEDCYPAEGPEIHILTVLNPKSGNEYLEDEWPVDERTLTGAILEYMEEEFYEN